MRRPRLQPPAPEAAVSVSKSPRRGPRGTAALSTRTDVACAPPGGPRPLQTGRALSGDAGRPLLLPPLSLTHRGRGAGGRGLVPHQGLGVPRVSGGTLSAQHGALGTTVPEG